ncbi:uncharacterized protein LOC119081484 [Bradysia coprophila]|uniref:uncharacterized protein LOC119081484 n=1 Tax=Bradysia coprophila TaxID=38358 RepID=UPI00187DA9AD|nr:uncharacterized protein LOC119081484 [Bradysia coprophila]
MFLGVRQYFSLVRFFHRYKILDFLEPTSCQVLTVSTALVTITLLSTMYTYALASILLATILLLASSSILTLKFLFVSRLLIIETDMIAPFFKSKDRTYKNWMKLMCQSVVYMLQFVEFGSVIALLVVSATFLSTLLLHFLFVRFLFVTILFLKLLLGLLQWLMMAFTTTICTIILVEIYVLAISYSLSALLVIFRDNRKMVKSEKFLIIL